MNEHTVFYSAQQEKANKQIERERIRRMKRTV
jgi:hypothetical protein